MNLRPVNKFLLRDLPHCFHLEIIFDFSQSGMLCPVDIKQEYTLIENGISLLNKYEIICSVFDYIVMHSLNITLVFKPFK